MSQSRFTRRTALKALAGVAATAATYHVPGISAAESEALKVWASAVAKVGAKDWSAMQGKAGTPLAVTAKSARADEAIQKMVVGDGNRLFDALTDNGGGMEDALASQKAIVPPRRLTDSKLQTYSAHLSRWRGRCRYHPLRG